MNALYAHTDTITLNLNKEIAPSVVIAAEPGKPVTLPSKPQTLRIITGCAWVSWRGEDYVLRANDELRIGLDINPVVISAEQHKSLLFEVY